jgi:uncharacterized protein (DUF736 family)
MSQYDNTNRGAAFRKNNDNPKAPKYSGPLNVNGVEYEVSIWEKISKNGDSFLSLSVKPPFKKGEGKFSNKASSFKPTEDEDIDF